VEDLRAQPNALSEEMLRCLLSESLPLKLRAPAGPLYLALPGFVLCPQCVCFRVRNFGV